MKLFKFYIIDNNDVELGETHLAFDTETTAKNWVLARNDLASKYSGLPLYKFGCEIK